MIGGARAYVALGSNLGDSVVLLGRAWSDLGGVAGVVTGGLSSIYRTEPLGVEEQPDYANACGELHTTLTPVALLNALFAIEARHGRERSGRLGPRTLDLDLLWYEGVVCDTQALVLPHPRLHERAFVLRPLAELAPSLVIPGRGPVAALLAATRDQRVDPWWAPTPARHQGGV